MLPVLQQVLVKEKDEEIIYRALVALGTLVFLSIEFLCSLMSKKIYKDDQCKTLAAELDIPKYINSFSSSSGAKIRECASEIKSVL